MKTLTSNFVLILCLAVIPFSTLHAIDNPSVRYDTSMQRINSDTVVFYPIEKMPCFPGGDIAMIKYLSKNIKYPQEARTNGIQGRVYVSFIIKADGSISEAKVLRGLGGGCDEEALRLINGMPNWEPGIQRGEPVRVQFNMPLLFKLKSKNSNKPADIAFEKGVELMDKEAYDKAIKKFSKSINSKKPKYRDSYINRGICKYHIKDYEGAVIDIRMGINLGMYINKKEIALIYSNIANYYFENDDAEQAIELYSESLSLNPEEREVYFNRGIAYLYLGNMEKACKDWHQAKELGLGKADTMIDERCK